MDEAGYDCRWQVLNSKDFGVPQNRERVFIIANLRSRGGREILPLCGENAATLNQLVGGMQGYRVYGTDGISATLVGNAGGVGAKTGLYLGQRFVLEQRLPASTARRRAIYSHDYSQITI